MRINGQRYPTVSDAASELGVTVKTVREWVNTGLIPAPPTVSRGTQEIDYFPPEYISDARRILELRRKERRDARRKRLRNGN